MRLPGAADYMDALQNPASCFADPELAAAVPALGPLGLPRAVSGNVAVVFRVDGADGRSWAVRCFVRPLDEERARYDAIGAHLTALTSSWQVPFELQPCGIRIDGNWWPVVKMDWAPGEPLLSYVARHLWDGAALGYLAARFADLCERLRDDGVAHGDLQHGNIVVAPGGDLRLVDYDGMYVPALAGRTGTERGHRNYQHPGRLVGDYGPDLDSFSAWVIYGSLAALAADPLLWGRLDGGEEALLVRHHDLEEPGRSAALSAMGACDGPGVAHLAGLLRTFLAVHPHEVPPLTPSLVPGLGRAGGAAGAHAGRTLADGAAAMRRARAVRSAHAGSPPLGLAFAPAPGTGAVPMDRPDAAAEVAGGTGPAGDEAVAAVAAKGAGDDDARRRSLFHALTAGTAGSPVAGAAQPEPTPPRPAPSSVEFRGNLHDARLTVAGASAAIAVVVLAALVGLAPVSALVAALAVAGAALARVHRLFGLTPEAEQARQVGAVLAGPRRTVDEAVARVERLSRRRAELADAEAAATGQATAERVRLRAREADELRGIDADLDVALAALDERERGVAVAEREARAAALNALQATVIDAQLRQYSLVSAASSGVSDQVVYRLAMNNVRTAADFTGVVVEKAGGVVVARDGRRLHVSCVDQHQATAMVAWRQRMAGVAQLKVPDSLPREQVAAIRAEHDAYRASLSREAEAARAAAKGRADEVRGRWQVEQDKVVERQKQVETDAARQRVELDRELAQASKDVAEAGWHLAEEHGGAGRPEPRLADYLCQVIAVGPLARLARRRRARCGHGTRVGPPGL